MTRRRSRGRNGFRSNKIAVGTGLAVLGGVCSPIFFLPGVRDRLYQELYYDVATAIIAAPMMCCAGGLILIGSVFFDGHDQY